MFRKFLNCQYTPRTKSSRMIKIMYEKHSFCVETSSDPDSHHAVMAMEAARKMVNTRQKLKTGHSVCYHLLKMLKNGDSMRFSEIAVGNVDEPKLSANDRVQFSLGF